jgi:hypothetical protein
MLMSPDLLYAFIDEKLSARIARSLADINNAHGHERFRGTDGKPLSWAVSIKTPLKDALINGFDVIDDISAFDQWIAVLEEAAAFLAFREGPISKRDRDRDMLRLRACLGGDLHAGSAELDCIERACACSQFRPEMLEPETTKRVLRLIKGGKLPGNR